MERGSRLRFVTFLTLVRFPLVLVFVFLAILRWARLDTWIFWLAFGTLVTAGLTDFFDGYFARRLGVETPFGAHADPLMDKFYYLCTLPPMIFLAAVNGHARHAVILLILTIVFLMRDLWVTFLRSFGAGHGADPRAHWSGKLRTAIGFPLVCLVYWHEEAPLSLPTVPSFVVYGMVAVAFAANLLSIHVYTRRYWKYARRVITPNSPRRDASAP